MGGSAHLPSAPCLFLLLLLCYPARVSAFSQHKQPGRKVAITTSRSESELRAREAELAAATRAGDPSTIAKASRSVLGLALREYGRLHLQEGKSAQAIEIYRRAIDFEDVPAAHLDLALADLYDGRNDPALSEATDVLVADPQNALAWQIQGQAWMVKGNYSQAVEALRKSAALQASAETTELLQRALARSKAPQNAQEQGRRTDILARLKKPAPADAKRREQSLRKMLGSALNDLGTAEARQEQFSLALAHFHEAEQWQADTPGLMRNIGMAASRSGDYKEAARALRPVVAADPNDTIARSLLGMALFTTGSYDEAARSFAPLGDSLLARPELAYAWAESLVKLNRYHEASALLEKLEGQPLATGMQMLVAQAWSEMGDYPRTVAACHRVLQADPKLAQAHYLAGMALIHESHPAEAAAEFRAELQQEPQNPDAEYHLAFVLFQLSQEQQAVRLLQDVLARTPEHPDANYELGKALLRAGKTAEAIPYLEAAARLKPGLDAVHYQLQSAYRSVGRKADADREANIYRDMKAKSRNITLPPPRPESASPPQSQ